METTVKERLIKYIKSKHISQSEFQKNIGVGNGYIANISKGIGGERLVRIREKYPDLNIDWLLYGEGEMINPTPFNSQSGDNNTMINGNNNSVTIAEHLGDYINMLKDKIAELTKDRDFWKAKCLSDREIAERVEKDMEE